MSSKRKLIIIVVGLPIVSFLVFMAYMIQPLAYLPHQKVVISVPFDKNDPPTGMIPMGETINHPKPQVPNGHPGIDFSWDHPARILSSSDGSVTYIKLGASEPNFWDVEVRSGVYLLRYKELKDYNHDLHSGS